MANRLQIPLVVTMHTDLEAYAAHYGNLTYIAGPTVRILKHQLDHLLRNHTNRIAQEIQNETPTAALVRRIIEVSDCVIAPTEKAAAKLRLIAPDHRPTVCPSGIDVPQDFLPWTRPYPDAGPKRLLYVGRVAPEKGARLLLDSLTQLLYRGNDVQLTLVGPVEISTHTIRRILRLLPPDAIHLTGPVQSNEVWKYYRHADLFIFPSATDTQGLALHEAAYSGLPIVLVDPELDLVADSRLNAILCHPTSESVANGIEMAIKKLSDLDWHANATRISRELGSRYLISDQVDHLSEIYEGLCDQRAGRQA